MEVVKKGRKRTNTKAFEKISAGGKETVIISTKEWKLATPPGANILRKYLKKEYVVRTLADGTGWVIKRV